MKTEIIKTIEPVLSLIDGLSIDDKIEVINKLRFLIHQKSPFNKNPVDYVEWVKTEEIEANNYNPNAVAPPEMKLLIHSIEHDGYTQPIVTDNSNMPIVIIDGFHRRQAEKKSKVISNSTYGYLPCTFIRNENKDLKDRMASTIRHNRARGKHGVKPMTEIITDLYLKGWDDNQIALELGMSKDEVLRLKQFTGLPELFKDRDYSKSW